MFHVESGVPDTGARKTAIATAAEQLAALPDVAGAPSPFSQRGTTQLSSDATTTFVPVPLDVSSAALIMIGVFGSFVLNGDPTVKQFGVGLSVAVFLAALAVLALVPAVLVLMGRRTWWMPGRLERVLPEVDTEGTSIRSPPATLPTLPTPRTRPLRRMRPSPRTRAGPPPPSTPTRTRMSPRRGPPATRRGLRTRRDPGRVLGPALILGPQPLLVGLTGEAQQHDRRAHEDRDDAHGVGPAVAL